MKKSVLLGVAALAAVTFAGTSADAGEVKIGGYYMFRMSHNDTNMLASDNTTIGSSSVPSDEQFWSHRLQLNLDMKASDKSHAHMRIRVVDAATVQGADVGTNRTGVLSANRTVDTPGGANPNWLIRQLWLETEAWGVGVKVGEMPLALNDNILVNNDTTAFGTIMLSKTFGNITVVGADVKVREDSIGGLSANGGTRSADRDDIDLYALSVLGKAGALNYQATLAYLYAQNDSTIAQAVTKANTDEATDLWLAATLNYAVAKETSITGTIIYENGMDNVRKTGEAAGTRGAATSMAGDQLGDSGYLVALRGKGKTNFGGWNAYGFYSSENYTNISATTPEWSINWDQGGPNARDLMNSLFINNNVDANGFSLSSPTENMWGVGAGLNFNVGKFVIKPSLDYGQVVETNLNNVAGDDVNVKSAWGGSVVLSTNIQQDTVLALTGQYVKPKLTQTGRNALCVAGGDCVDSLHQLTADIKMSF